MRTLILSLVAVFFLTSCGEGGGNSDKICGFEVDSTVVDTVAALTDNTHSPHCEIHLCLRHFRGLRRLNDAMASSGIILPEYIPKERLPIDQYAQSIAQNCINGWREQFARLYKSDLSNADQYNYTYKVYSETLQGPDSTFCYVAHILSGNADNRQWHTVARNFHLPTARRITLDDIFVPGYNNGLLRIITQKMMDRFNARSEHELSEKGVFANDGPYLPDNFILQNHRIVFFYAPEEVAPRDAGELRIEVGKKEIKHLLKNQ